MVMRATMSLVDVSGVEKSTATVACLPNHRTLLTVVIVASVSADTGIRFAPVTIPSWTIWCMNLILMTLAAVAPYVLSADRETLVPCVMVVVWCVGATWSMPHPS